jgi:WD40 repeat protein
LSDFLEKRSVIDAFSQALDQSAFVLKESPELTFPQIYNRAQWEAEKNELLKKKLSEGESKFQKPWLKLLDRPAESTILIRTFTGHTSSVDACAFSPDGRRIVSASSHELKTWDVESGKEINTLKDHTEWVQDCA